MTIASSTILDLKDTVAGVFDGLLPLILIFFGTLLAFFIARNIIKLLPRAK